MSDDEASDQKERQRSLLSFWREPSPAREDASEGAPAGMGDDRPGAALRHRIARARREARESPLLAALARAGDPQDAGPASDASDEAEAASPASSAAEGGERSPGWTERLAGWLRPRSAALPPAPDAPPAAAAAAHPFAVAAPPSVVSIRSGPADDDRWRPLVDPVRVFSAVGASRWLIFSATVLGGVAGVLIALSTPKQYQAFAEILVDPRDLQLVEREVAPSGLPSDATLAVVENQARVLASGTVLNKVVERLNLAADPEFNGEGGGFGLGSPIDLLRALLSGGDEESAADAGRRHYLAVDSLSKRLEVERGNRTFIISVGVRTENPEKSALIANTITEEFIRTAAQLQSDTAGRAAEDLTARLDQLRADVEAAERKVAQFKAENDIVDAQGRLITDDEIVALNQQLTAARARTAELNARAASTRGIDVDDIAEGNLPEQVSSPAMTELRAQYARLKQQADRLAVKLGPRHPERAAVEAELAATRAELAAELRRIAQSIQVELRRAVQLEQELASRLAQLKVRQGGLGDDLVALRELERDATAKRAVYEAFLLRARETGEQQGISTANISVISSAYPPLLPSGPSRLAIALAGAGLGFLAGLAWAVLAGAWASLRENAAARRAVASGAAVPASPAAEHPAFEQGASFADPEGALRGSVPAGAPVADSTSLSTTESPATEQPAAVAETGETAMTYAHARQPAEAPAWSPYYGPAAYGAFPQAAAQPLMQPEPGMVWVQAPAWAAWPHQGAQHPAHAMPAQPGQHAYAPGWHPAQHAAPQPALHPAAMQPAPAQPATAPVQPASVQQAAPQQAPAADSTQASLEEIRNSLREFREAVRELTESRQRRRYF